ncbi:fumarylacetoacetate hydrolase family protein [Pedobacter flavus]|uniref:Fumarylacetoacetate hydrolase family protein n=1 Tax=Pedobacter flavus TaxID=3113906 RepID=A0ABU7H1Z9_9SPHI|nr:fumarylacetoacetate hydrolase family protein [Pedobacter sp. VNH31]MEE1885175.1 fumarylacetoacetate hydrolase family protein [Pedobacter sp. VNH31]
MKVIAIGRNYAEHAKELNNAIPESPVIFLKPDTAVTKDNKPFYIPDFSQDIHFELEIVLKVCKEGKSISEKFAHKYFEEIGLGIDYTARDIQTKQKNAGLPWELAKAFDGSAAISKFKPITDFPNLYDLNFQLKQNGELKQNGNTKDLIFSFEKIISFVSKYITLKKGDLIFTGTPAGVGKVNIGDILQCYLENEEMLNIEIR